VTRVLSPTDHQVRRTKEVMAMVVEEAMFMKIAGSAFKI